MYHLLSYLCCHLYICTFSQVTSPEPSYTCELSPGYIFRAISHLYTLSWSLSVVIFLLSSVFVLCELCHLMVVYSLLFYVCYHLLLTWMLFHFRCVHCYLLFFSFLVTVARMQLWIFAQYSFYSQKQSFSSSYIRNVDS